MNLQDTKSYNMETSFSEALKHKIGEPSPEQIWVAFSLAHAEILELLAYAFHGETKTKPSETALLYRMEDNAIKCWFEALDTGKRYDELLRQNQMLHAEIKALTEELESLDNCGMRPLC